MARTKVHPQKAERREFYVENGYVILDHIFPQDQIACLAQAFSPRLSRNGNGGKKRTLDEQILAAEAEDHRLVYNGAQSVGSSAAAHFLLGRDAFSDALLAVTGLEGAGLHFLPMYFVVQLPGDERFDYGWHQDRAYYSWCDELVALWFPVNRRVSKETGTISVIPGSHRKGARTNETHFRHGYFRQIDSEVEAAEIANEEVLDLELGACCIMEGNLVHRSIANRSSTPRVAAVVRMVNLSEEATYERERFYCVHKS
jgi:phytanoyl-CoA hydroxylase